MPQQGSDQSRSQSGSGPFRLSLQLPEKKRQQLQAHERKQTTSQSSNNNGSSGGSSSGGSAHPNGPMTPAAGNAGGSFYNNSPSTNNNNKSSGSNANNSNTMNPGGAASYIHQQAPEGFGDSPVPTQYPFTIGMHVPGYTAADHQAVQQARTTSMSNASGMNKMQQQAGQMAAPLSSALANNPHSYVPIGMGLAGPAEGMSPGGSIGSYNDQGGVSGGPGTEGGRQSIGGGSNLMPGVPDPETFEFMKRKRWPQLLMQELVGAAVWCLIPYDSSPQTGPGRGRSGWKIIFASPATHELLGYKPEEVEGNDWADFVYPIDLARLMQNIRASIASSNEPTGSPPQQHHFQLSSSRTSAFDPPTVSTNVPLGNFAGPSKSLNVYTRMVCKDGKETLFELRGHPYFGDEYDEPGTPDSSGSNGGFDGGGVMGTTRAQRRSFQAGIGGGMGMDDDDERSCKAFWVMGRKWQGQGDGGAKMLDSFLELKMENERLRQELRDLQARPFAARQSVSQYNPMPPSASSSKNENINTGYMGNLNSSDEDDDDDDDDDDRSMMQARNMSTSGPVGMQNIQFQTNESFQLGGGLLDDKKAKKPKLSSKNPEYLCRNCGRNDSPEWRKGPLGPKTLCNACGLRWAKRNAGNIPRRKPKDKDKDDGKEGGPSMDTESIYDAGMMDMA